MNRKNLQFQVFLSLLLSTQFQTKKGAKCSVGRVKYELVSILEKAFNQVNVIVLFANKILKISSIYTSNGKGIESGHLQNGILI